MRSKEEIEEKIEELSCEDENFCEVGWGLGCGGAEFGVIYNEEIAKKTLKSFSEWLLKHNEKKEESECDATESDIY